MIATCDSGNFFWFVHFHRPRFKDDGSTDIDVVVATSLGSQFPVLAG